MNEFLRGLSDTGKLLVVVLLFCLVSILISLWTGGLAATVVVSATICSILTITKGAWESEYDAKTNVRLVSLGLAFFLAVSQPQWRSIVNPILEPLFELLPISEDILPPDSPSIAVLIFVVLVIYIVNYFMRDSTAMKEHPIPIDEEFPEKKYKERLKSFVGVLLDDLNKIDRETNWSAEYFTPLDAEVEVQSGSKRLKKVTDLLNAIRADHRSRVFLVLGDPGSGKSVALRKLARELLKESERTGKVPLYINLREWESKNTWTEENPPTVEELYEFVIENLKSRGDIFTNEFIDAYFKKMFEYGRLFIIFDSFDEIPSVLDVGEGSWLIDELSDVIHRFLAGANESRGILASRIFRRPTSKFATKTTLEIRPFTESKIIATLQKSLSYDKKLIELIFKERQEFVPIARNPFTAALISSYAQDHNNNLPQTQAELYSSYIDRRLDACKDRLQRKNLTKDQIIQCAIDIADTMLTTQALGLEATAKSLRATLSNHPVEDVIEILRYARLGRLGAGDENRFSFVHRRFNEYFVVQRLIEQPQRVPQDAIPTDSRWRDSLVLYCEVADEEQAKQIANFCWSEILKVTENNVDMRDPQFLRMLHCLRFLKEAFRARLNCIEDFQEDLSEFIKSVIEGQENLLFKKFAVEAVGLLKDEDIDAAITKAISLENEWISETALKSCRHLPRISQDLEKKLKDYIDSFSIPALLGREDELSFSFKLSNGFSNVESFLNLRVMDAYCFLCSAFLLFIISPQFTFFSILAFMFFSTFGMSARGQLFNPSYLFSFKSRKVVGLHLRFLYLLPFLFVAYCIISFNLTTIGNSITSISKFLNVRASSDDGIWVMGLFDLILPKQSILIETILCVLIVFFLIPYYQLFYRFTQIFRYLMGKKHEFLARLFLMMGAFAFVPTFLYLIEKFSWLQYLLALISIISLLVIVFAPTSNSVSDYIRIRNLRRFGKLKRRHIAKQFMSYKTRWGRLKYVEFLQNENIKPEGRWRNGKIPNIDNDEASTLLAKLEEKWLGLDR